MMAASCKINFVVLPIRGLRGARTITHLGLTLPPLYKTILFLCFAFMLDYMIRYKPRISFLKEAASSMYSKGLQPEGNSLSVIHQKAYRDGGVPYKGLRQMLIVNQTKACRKFLEVRQHRNPDVATAWCVDGFC
jgi:hypothetical protein